ncbi:hypothetical protein SDC9_71141 [bioreactor metagenome]|uniref:Uncharacterized protein n=1 Tax=bioreactor metagenome TaxID=1076179 RepID=A0A644Y9Q5_9ZZZZ
MLPQGEPGRRGGGPPLLPSGSLRVELDDQLLLHVDRDLLTGRQLVHEDLHLVRASLEPRRHGALGMGLAGHHERGDVERLLLDLDDVMLGDAVRRDVDLPAVHQEVPVVDELTGLAAGRGEPGAVHDVVQTRLEDAQQVVTGAAGLTVGLLVVAGELLLQHAVGEPRLLLLAQLQRVLGVLGAAAAVHARRVGAALERLVVADEISPETTGLLGHGAGVTGHSCSVLC